VRIRSDDEQKTTTEPLAGLQGHGISSVDARTESIENHTDSVQPIVPRRGLANIIAPHGAQALGIAVQIRENAADIGRIERHVNHRIEPIELPFDLTARVLALRRRRRHIDPVPEQESRAAADQTDERHHAFAISQTIADDGIG
jgi:hypothetical protein